MNGTEASSTRSAIAMWPDETTYSNQRLRVSLELVDEVTSGILNPDIDAWLEWIRNVPTDARGIHIGLKTSENLDDCDSASDSLSMPLKSMGAVTASWDQKELKNLLP
jgi:hypothetical protein